MTPLADIAARRLSVKSQIDALRLHFTTKLPDTFPARYANVPVDGTLTQVQIDTRYAQYGGGRVPIKEGLLDLANSYFRIPNGIIVSGDDWQTTRVTGNGPGAILRFGTYWPGESYTQSNRIEEITLDSAHCGISLDDSAKTEGSGMEVRRVRLRCPETGISLRHSNGQYVYSVTLEDVGIVDAALAVDILGVNTRISRLVCSHAEEGAMVPAPLMKLTGTGSLSDCVVHGYQPQLRGSTWNVKSLWLESTRGMLIDGAHVNMDSTEQCFAQPKQPIRLINGARLDVAGVLGFTDNNGMVPNNDKDRKALLKQCFPCSGGSVVTERGAEVNRG